MSFHNKHQCVIRWHKFQTACNLSIQAITYENGWYYAVTSKDRDNCFWVLDISKEKTNYQTINTLNKRYVGKTVEIYYTSQYEIITWEIIDY